MDSIIQKRTDLINFFLNEEKQYTKEDILNREFSVLSFSPKEEYIDFIHSPFDDLCVDLSTYVPQETPEMFLKGIIVDVDRQKFQTIIHVQNKDATVSISCQGSVLNHYSDMLIVGEPIIAKCKVFRDRLYLSLMMHINNMDSFQREYKYFTNELHQTIDIIMEDRKDNLRHYGLIVECILTKNKNDRDMVIGTLYDGDHIRGFATVKTKFNPTIPKEAMAGDFVVFDRPTMDFILNDVRVVDL